MEKSGEVSGSKPREMGKSEDERSEVGLPAIDPSPNKRNPGQSITDSDDRYRLIVATAEQAGHGKGSACFTVFSRHGDSRQEQGTSHVES